MFLSEMRTRVGPWKKGMRKHAWGLGVVVMLATSAIGTHVRAQGAPSAGDHTLYLTPPIADQREFGLAQNLASTAHICTGASRSVQVSLLPNQPPQTLQIAAKLKDDASLRYCELAILVRRQDGKVIYQNNADFMAMQGVMNDIIIAIHKFGTREMIIIDENDISNNTVSSLYIPDVTQDGAYRNPILYLTSGERISFSFRDEGLVIQSKYFNGSTNALSPPCCFEAASFSLFLNQRGTGFLARGNKMGMNLFRQLAANAARKPGALGPLPSDQTGDTHSSDIHSIIKTNSLGLKVSDWRTYWIYGLPNDSGTAYFCVPAVSFKVTNGSNQNVDAIQITASFLDEAKKETFGSATKIWSTVSGYAPLPPSYSRKVELHSSRGFVVAPYSCTAASRPTITVQVQAQSLATDNEVTLGQSIVASEMRHYQRGQ